MLYTQYLDKEYAYLQQRRSRVYKMELLNNILCFVLGTVVGICGFMFGAFLYIALFR